jgi:hypothetical protein
MVESNHSYGLSSDWCDTTSQLKGQESLKRQQIGTGQNFTSMKFEIRLKPEPDDLAEINDDSAEWGKVRKKEKNKEKENVSEENQYRCDTIDYAEGVDDKDEDWAKRRTEKKKRQGEGTTLGDMEHPLAGVDVDQSELLVNVDGMSDCIGSKHKKKKKKNRRMETTNEVNMACSDPAIGVEVSNRRDSKLKTKEKTKSENDNETPNKDNLVHLYTHLSEQASVDEASRPRKKRKKERENEIESQFEVDDAGSNFNKTKPATDGEQVFHLDGKKNKNKRIKGNERKV